MEKYFYFRFTDTFFRQKTIRNMKHIPIYGYQFIVIYLELCALATEEHGILKIPKMGEVPYISLIAKDIGEDVELTGTAFTYFLNNGLLEKIEDDDVIKLIVPIVVNNTGKSSKRADQRRLEYNALKYKSLPGSKTEYREYGLFKKVFLTDAEYADIETTVKDFEKIIKDIDIKKAMGNHYELSDYELIKKTGKKK